MIYIVDFGSQVAHLISRRIKKLGVETKIILPEKLKENLALKKPQGIILSGGPASVCRKNSLTISKEVFSLNVPILGICYGLQLLMKLLGGKVVPGKKEYGPAKLKLLNSKSDILNNLPRQSTVWVSHGDEVVKLAPGFQIIGSTEKVPVSFVEDASKKIYGAQFHPEVEHTEIGIQIFQNFLKICKVKKQLLKIDIQGIIQEIKNKVGESFVIGAVSGGVDSTVAAFLTAKAIGRQFIPIYIDNGLMRFDTKEHLEKIFKHIKIKVEIINTKKGTLQSLKGVVDSEKKRKIIGNLYIQAFEEEMRKLVRRGKKVNFLMQGTIYSDIIESKGTKNADKIKIHHNVGGLPRDMKLKLLEPLRMYYKDEVREIGRILKLPKAFIEKQPFPGPGYAVRIRGEVTKKRLEEAKIADKIVLEELARANLLGKLFQSFPVLTQAYSTAVKGDGRNFGEVIALRVIESKDVMTCKWANLPSDLLQKISSRIVNEIPGISRVVYDITTKPPATMEWE